MGVAEAQDDIPRVVSGFGPQDLAVHMQEVDAAVIFLIVLVLGSPKTRRQREEARRYL